MRIPRKLATAVATAAIASLAFSSVASAATLSYTLDGDATPVVGGVELTADAGGAGYGAVDFNVPAPIALSDIDVLRTTYMPAAGDDCGGGSPRFILDVEGPGYIYVNVGVFPNYACPGGGDSGNLMTTAESRFSLEFITCDVAAGNQFYASLAEAMACVGSRDIVDIFLLIDSWWSAATTGGDGIQIITVAPTVEVTLPSPTNKNQCKKGGWEGLFRANGTAFKNQGDCIQYVNTGK